MEPIITTTALASFLSLLFTEGGKTLAVEGVKLALEKREDIKNGFVNLFKRDEIIKLGLNEEKTPDEVTKSLKDNPEIAKTLTTEFEANQELLNRLLEIVKKQTGKDSSNLTINAKNIAAAGNVTIQNQTNNFS